MFNPTSFAAGAALAATVAAAEPSAFSKQDTLDRQELLALVLERNPGLEAARQALRAAEARTAQDTALEDPKLTYSFAPLSVAGPAKYGQVVELSQMLPFPGKRGLRGEVAQAEAAAAKESLAGLRFRLALAASLLFDDLFVVHRALAINDEQVGLLQQLKKTAEAQYVAGRAAQQDALQAEVELTQILRDKVMLESERDMLRAQLNGLIHRAPHAPVPPPPAELEVAIAEPPASEALQEQALQQRPELAAVRARQLGGDAAVRLARRGYLPDFALMASYNSMWMDAPHQFMAGISVNLPIQIGTRRAAVDEARARLEGLRSEEAQLVDQVRVEVELARIRLVEAQRLHHIYRTQLVPAAKDQVLAARAGFEAAKLGFSTLLEAQRNLRTTELRAHVAIADLHRRSAELARAVGHREVLP